MITCELFNRLANNMFQIATTYGIAESYNDVAEFPPFQYFNLPPRTRKIQSEFKEKVGRNELLNIPYRTDMCLNGWFIRHEYFDHIREKLIKDVFKVPDDPQPHTVCIHVRRGDYLKDPINFPTQPIEYYIDSVRRTILPSAYIWKIVICSDDINWCKEKLINSFYGIGSVYFRENTSALNDIYFGANCDAVVMSNSTFSFWMSYLGRQNRPIIYPKYNWFAKGSGRDGSEICLNNWIGI